MTRSNSDSVPDDARGAAPGPTSGRHSSFARAGVGVFLAALVVRLAFLWDVSDSPTFWQPIVDARAHLDIATALANGDELPKMLFWRSVFYPIYLSVVLAWSDGSLLVARVLGALLGALTAYLAYRLARQHFDQATGVCAGLLTALCGPLVFWESELLAVGWAAFWSLALIALYCRAATPAYAREPLGLVVLGLVAGLAVLTRPSFLPFVVLATMWLIWELARGSTRMLTGGSGGARGAEGAGEIPASREAVGAGRAIALSMAAFALGFLVVVVPVTIAAKRVTGRASFLPGAGLINLYIGNNPDRCEMLAIRPGHEWQSLMERAGREGHVGWSARSSWFGGQVVDYGLAEPGAFLGGMAHKLAQLMNGREIPRNIDPYAYHAWSGWLTASVWKVGRFGFPWGVLLPLALVGLVIEWRRVPAPLALFVATYPLVVTATFIASRYRAPLYPAVCILAAVGALGIARRLRSRGLRAAAAPLAAALVLAGIFSLPGPSCEEEIDYRAEMYALLATQAAEPDAARALYETALELDPDSLRARRGLGTLLAQLQEREAAIHHLDLALEARPDALTHLQRGLVRKRSADIAGALADFDAAIALDPGLATVYLQRGLVLYQQDRWGEAERDWRVVLTLSRDERERALARQGLDRLGTER